MALNAPTAVPEASSEVADKAARTEQTPVPDAGLRAIEQQRQGTVVDTAAKTEEILREVQDQAGSSTDTPSDASGSAPEEDSEAKAGFLAGSLSWISKQFEGISKFFTDTGNTFGKWLKKMMGIEEEEPKEEGSGDEEPAEPESDEPEISTEVPGEELITPDDATGLLEVSSWDEVMAIEDLPTRVLQAALYAEATNMDCFTKDGNHCSGWCDSVFNKAGLNLYDDKSRIYCNYKTWPKKGTMQGLELQPGDSIIRHNGNAATGDHQEIIVSSYGPDEDGDYQVVTVGQTSVKGKSGVRKIRSMVIHSKDIRVVIRPGATEPFEGKEPIA